MITYLTRTATGYSHLREKKVCQDYSACYHDEERTIVTACDGHGGATYVRSDRGSKYASDAVIRAFGALERSAFYRYTKKEICNKLRLQILCEWNARVERDIYEKRFTKAEISRLDEEQVFRLKQNPVKAYGTTLQGAMIFANKVLCATLGDGGAFLLRKGVLYPIGGEDDETVANLTYSMSQEDAYEQLQVGIFDFSDIDGVLLCTDGVINPYQCLGNFQERFAKPVCLKLQTGQHREIADFIDEMGCKIGIGDDVSLALAMKSGVSLRGYRS